MAKEPLTVRTRTSQNMRNGEHQTRIWPCKESFLMNPLNLPTTTTRPSSQMSRPESRIPAACLRVRLVRYHSSVSQLSLFLLFPLINTFMSLLPFWSHRTKSLLLIPHLHIAFAVMNPGSIPDSRILGTTDRTVVFEEQYQTYINRQAAKALAALPDRDVLCALMHSIPPDMPNPQLKALVNELRELSGSLFLTDLSENYYQRFSPRFQEYIDAMV